VTLEEGISLFQLIQGEGHICTLKSSPAGITVIVPMESMPMEQMEELFGMVKRAAIDGEAKIEDSKLIVR
jgi:hypothetical protein